jgi:pimeloyl-ACP methyl ester carboxylesterase
MAEIGEWLIADAPAGFAERHVDADGFRIRYLEAGQGPPLVHLHGAGGPRLGRVHDLLAARFGVIAFEVPGFGESPENQRSGFHP